MAAPLRCVATHITDDPSTELVAAAIAAGARRDDGAVLQAARAGAATARLAAWVPMRRAARERAVIAAAGGIRADNTAAYAASGVDGLATSALYQAPPLDFAARMQADG